MFAGKHVTTLDLAAAEERLRTAARALEARALAAHRDLPVLVKAAPMLLVDQHTTASMTLQYALSRFSKAGPITGASLDQLLQDLLVARELVRLVDEVEAELDRKEAQGHGC